eukprot:2280268-Pleurochrysis_carterae.AAC.2
MGTDFTDESYANRTCAQNGSETACTLLQHTSGSCDSRSSGSPVLLPRRKALCARDRGLTVKCCREGADALPPRAVGVLSRLPTCVCEIRQYSVSSKHPMHDVVPSAFTMRHESPNCNFA